MSTESTTAAPGTTPSTDGNAAADADMVILPLVTLGGFDPAEELKVRFAIHDAPMPIHPPVWQAAVTVQTDAGKTIASFVISSGQKRTVNVPAVMPGAVQGTLNFAIPQGKPELTCAYDLKQGGVHLPNPKTGMYTFAW